MGIKEIKRSVMGLTGFLIGVRGCVSLGYCVRGKVSKNVLCVALCESTNKCQYFGKFGSIYLFGVCMECGEVVVLLLFIT